MGAELEIIHQKLLEIILEVDRICTKHNIEYHLSWGSALGAARHGGFIPWDDDVDIDMERSQYRKFYKACKKELNREKFFLQTQRTEPALPSDWMRIRMNGTSSIDIKYMDLDIHYGLSADIFKLYYVPKAKWLFSLLRWACVKKRVLASAADYGGVVGLLGRYHLAMPLYFLLDALADLASMLCPNRARLYSYYGGVYASDYGGVSPIDGFDACCILPVKKALFEGHKLSVPNDLDAFLTQRYGDWRTPIKPPEGSESSHVMTVFDPERDYKEYIVELRAARESAAQKSQ